MMRNSRNLIKPDQRRCKRRGTTIVEFALVLPVLLALVLGVIEFGWLTRNQLAVSNAVREGVRFAALGNTSTTVRTRIRNSASVLNPGITDAQIVLTQTSDRTTVTPTYTGWPADTTTTPARNGVAVGNSIRVTVNYPHRALTGFFPFLRDRQITVAATMTREAA